MSPWFALVRRPVCALQDWIMGPADPRAYGAVRVAFALTAAAIWVDLWSLRQALFASTGNLGPAPASDSLRINVFQWVNTPAQVTAVFVVAALAILGLGFGLWQRACALIVYVWFTSYSSAASLALGGFDTVARVTSFAVAVSPCVAVFTLRKSSAAESEVPSYGLRILQWQLMLIYWVTLWLKAPDRYWRQGEVISHFGVSMFARSPNPEFADIGALDPLLTWGTLLIEFGVPLLLWKRSTRWFGMFLGLCLHGSIAILGKLALFSLSMLPLYLAFLERHDFEQVSALWRFLRSWVSRRSRSQTL